MLRIGILIKFLGSCQIDAKMNDYNYAADLKAQN
ncbi:MAG: hypothetical protein METHSR3v1_1190001 [Methanothrix sp.]|nr:MAG: hypothetical protein METHSR3v1_1190001 [Methanothrix sp.]